MIAYKSRILVLTVILVSLLLILPIWLRHTSLLKAQIPPYKESPVIASLTWAPRIEIRRAAFDSDNFPMTWADDDKLYTAYGDGYGFEPQRQDKLSLGFASVSGGPTDFVGRNIVSSAEVQGDGPTIPKSSGLLMVDSVLYMWQRNSIPSPPRSIGCRLGWSTDYAKNWEWSEWVMTDFGFCGFINFGKNYDHSRDDYVYTVTHNHPSAYRSARYFVLMRVDRAQIRDLSEYEYFVGLDDDGNPMWSYNVEERGPVFERPTDGYARRSSITYNHVLKRYFWWQGFNNSDDVRDFGGIGIYDAPEPWGPWTQVYYNLEWDVGPGDLGNFPSKWISEDGLTMYLVFSGYDSFAVRKATLELRVTPTPTLVPTATPTFTPTPTSTSTPTSTPTPTGTPSIMYDTDNDGVFDLSEDRNSNTILDDDDTDEDGIPDYQDVDDDGDGIPTSQEILNEDGKIEISIDFDKDQIPNYLDEDDDGDGTMTKVEGLGDRNENNVPDYLDVSAVSVAFVPLLMDVRYVPPPPVRKQISVQIASDLDDAEQDGNQHMNIESPDLEIGIGMVGLRFVDLPMVQGGRIISASILFEADETSDGTAASFSIVGEDVDNARHFESSIGDITYRTRTSAITLWDDVPQWVKYGYTQESPDIGPIVQEIVNRPGWQAGNAMAFIITGSGLRVAEAFNDDFYLSPILQVTYEEE